MNECRVISFGHVFMRGRELIIEDFTFDTPFTGFADQLYAIASFIRDEAINSQQLSSVKDLQKQFDQLQEAFKAYTQDYPETQNPKLSTGT